MQLFHYGIQHYGIQHYGISDTTLEEVRSWFMTYNCFITRAIRGHKLRVEVRTTIFKPINRWILSTFQRTWNKHGWPRNTTLWNIWHHIRGGEMESGDSIICVYAISWCLSVNQHWWFASKSCNHYLLSLSWIIMLTIMMHLKKMVVRLKISKNVLK